MSLANDRSHPPRDAPGPGTASMRGLLLLVAATAATLGLARWTDSIGFVNGAWVIVLLAVIPWVLLAERIFHGGPQCSGHPPWPRLVLNLVALFVAALVPAAVVAKDYYLPFPPPAWWMRSPLPLLDEVLWDTGLPLWIQICVPAVTFLLLNGYLLFATGPQLVPWRIPLLLALTTFGSAVWFTLYWDFTRTNTGPRYLPIAMAANGIAIVLFWGCWAFVRRRAAMPVLLLLGVAIHSWLFWFAFPRFTPLL